MPAAKLILQRSVSSYVKFESALDVKIQTIQCPTSGPIYRLQVSSARNGALSMGKTGRLIRRYFAARKTVFADILTIYYCNPQRASMTDLNVLKGANAKRWANA